MTNITIVPLKDVPSNPLLASLPKADLHLHQEEIPRLERIIARRQGRTPYNWRQWMQHLIANTPPGRNRLMDMYVPDATFALENVHADTPELIVAKVVDALEEAAADGAILVEMRFGVGGQAMQRPDFMMLFREAERHVQMQYPHLHAEALALLPVTNAAAALELAELHLEMCLRLAQQGLAGIDFLVSPYDTEVDPNLWQVISSWAIRAAAAGLGITLHAGEFSPANLAKALHVPHLGRIGHAVYAAAEPHLFEQLVYSGVTVECSLSCNVVLGAVESYEAHPIQKFMAAGIPVTLNTDDPVRIGTTIGREYAIAAALGCSPSELLTITHNAIQASFTSAACRTELLARVRQWHG